MAIVLTENMKNALKTLGQGTVTESTYDFRTPTLTLNRKEFMGGRKLVHKDGGPSIGSVDHTGFYPKLGTHFVGDKTHPAYLEFRKRAR
jgi:hypothetical protein